MKTSQYKGYKIEVEQDGMGWWCWTASRGEWKMTWSLPFDSMEEAFWHAKAMIDDSARIRAISGLAGNGI